MKIATSPFVYWGVAVFMAEKVGNRQKTVPSDRDSAGAEDFGRAVRRYAHDSGRHASRAHPVVDDNVRRKPNVRERRRSVGRGTLSGKIRARDAQKPAALSEKAARPCVVGNAKALRSDNHRQRAWPELDELLATARDRIPNLSGTVPVKSPHISSPVTVSDSG